MRLSLPELTPAQILIAQNPEIGLESNVLISPVEVVKLGTVKVDAAGVATWLPKPGADFGAGVDIHCAIDEAIIGAAAPVVTFDVTLEGDLPDTAVATFAIPAWVQAQGHFYPIGDAVDVLPAGLGNEAKLVVEILDVVTVTGVPPNSEFSVYGSGPAENFVQLGWKRGVDGPYATSATVPIADRYNPSAAIKKGRSEVAELTLDFVHVSSKDGITRYSGMRTSVLVRVIKDGTVTTEHVLYLGYRPNGSPKRGDGNDEVIETSTGAIERCIRFVAP